MVICVCADILIVQEHMHTVYLNKIVIEVLYMCVERKYDW